jgi:ABC-type amino acid transport system permease subunit
VSRTLDWTAYAIVGGIFLAIAIAAIRGFLKWIVTITAEEWSEFFAGLAALAIVAAAAALVWWAFSRSWDNLTGANHVDDRTIEEP